MRHDRSALHTMIVDALDEQIAVIDRSGTIIDVNAAWDRFGAENGLSTGFVTIGGSYLGVLYDATASGDRLAGKAARGISDILDGKRSSFYLEYPCHSPNRQRWFMMRITVLRGGPEPLFVIAHYDITERKRAEEKAEYLALHDPLTGLANRRHFNEGLSREIRRDIRSQSAITLLEIDVDHFKDYNDERGHPAGDRCLIRIGKVLRAFARRPGDMAARLGGDEFALILEGSDHIASRRIIDAIRKKVHDLNMSYGDSRRITVSIGAISMIPRRHQTNELLLEEADRALYRAKLAGRDCVVHEQADGASA